jgi:hypothetical protein
MNHSLARDVEAIRQMIQHLERFQHDVEDKSLPIYVRQAAAAAVIELKQSISVKMRDIKRRMKERNEY